MAIIKMFPIQAVLFLSFSCLFQVVRSQFQDRRVDDSQLIRIKRQWNPLAQCPNGGQRLGVACYSAVQCTPYYTGPTACLNKCCCTVPNPQPPPDLFDFCPDGFQSSIRCSAAGQCSQGQICMNGLCCRLTGQEYLYACGGERALSSCTNGMCNQGFACVPSNYCCECPVGRKGGSCWNGQPCAPGFFCQPNGYCCASCPGNQTPLGTCTNGQCGGERRCMPGNICC